MPDHVEAQAAQLSAPEAAQDELPAIPLHDLQRQWPEQLFDQEIERAKWLLALGSRHYPRFAVRLADRLSRNWLKRSGNPYLGEIDAMNARLCAPGIFFLNINYEWGCTSGVSATREGGSLLRRVLDWPMEGLGAGIVAVRCESEAGPWINLTWPGFTGSIQGMAAGRFSAAIHQAPMPRRTPLMPLDWAVNRRQVWNSRAIPPAHLLRQVFESCASYGDARRMLMETELALPAIFLLSGTKSDEGCVIERSQTEAFLRQSPASAGNHWQSNPAKAKARGKFSEARSAAILRHPEEDREKNPQNPVFSWLEPPILNDTTRLAMTADASRGELLVQGFEEASGKQRKRARSDVAVPATAVLHLGPSRQAEQSA